MSDISQNKLSRRRFLQAAVATAGGAVALGPRLTLGQEQKEQIRWALLSDTHIAADPNNRYRGFYPYRNLRQVVAQITSELPEGLIVTGDLARLRGHSEDYENLKTLLAPVVEQRPTYLAIGNHDHRGNFLRAFEHSDDGAWAVNGKHIVTVNAGPVRLVILDTLLFVDLPWGQLGHTQRHWLEMYLRACDDKPMIVFLHHPVGGGTSLLDAGRLLNIIKPAVQVKAVVHGHSHVFGFSQFEGIHLINLPATGYNSHRGDPVGWVEARLASDGGEFLLHAIGGNTEMNGHVEKLRWRT